MGSVWGTRFVDNEASLQIKNAKINKNTFLDKSFLIIQFISVSQIFRENINKNGPKM